MQVDSFEWLWTHPPGRTATFQHLCASRLSAKCIFTQVNDNDVQGEKTYEAMEQLQRQKDGAQ